MNIQDEIAKIHAQYGTSEKANYEIQLFFDAEIKKNEMISTGVGIIHKERQRQIEELRFDYTNHELYGNEQLARAGSVYALPEIKRNIIFSTQMVTHYLKEFLWPWDDKYWKPTPDDRIKELAKAGALIAAQIDYELNKQK